ncbi:hypothetical protein SMMN14_03010 [Sphaerulina musiva]
MSPGREITWTNKQFAMLRKNPKYSDLEIRCDGRVFKLHRAIVCTMSKTLTKECDGQFREAKSGIIDHTTFCAETLDMMLQFMYTHTYTLPVAGTDTTTTATTTSIDVEHGVQSSNNTTAGDAAAAEGTGTTTTTSIDVEHGVQSSNSTTAGDVAAAEGTGTTTTTSIDVEHDVQSSDSTTAGDDGAAEATAASGDADAPGKKETASQLAKPSLDPKTSLVLAHIDVYAIGDYYDVPPLRTLAHKNIMTCLSKVEHAEFIHLVLATWKSTAARKDCLRQSIIRETVARAKFLFQDKHFMTAISEGKELCHFAADVLSALQKAAESSEATKRAKIESLEDVLGPLKEEAKAAAQLIESLRATIASRDRARLEMLHVALHTVNCHNCGNYFGGYIAADRPPPDDRHCFLYCRNCRHRHDI